MTKYENVIVFGTIIGCILGVVAGAVEGIDTAKDEQDCPSGQKIIKIEHPSPFSSVLKIDDCILKVNDDIVGKDGRIDTLLYKHYRVNQTNSITFLIKRGANWTEVK